MNDKKENRFPIFDLVLILLIALAVAGGVFWIRQRQNVQKVDVTYTFRMDAVSNDYSGYFAADKTVYSEAGVVLGTISDASVTRAVIRSFDATPASEPDHIYTYSESRSTEKSDVILTVTVTAEKKSGGYFADSVRIAAGNTISVRISGGYIGTGEILTVKEAAQ